MKILHYALGFPPYRTGGMTKFCIDLMKQQNNDGHQVALMWPGQMGIISKKTFVKDRGNAVIDGKTTKIRSFEVINPLPICYDEGISEFDLFMADSDSEIYIQLLDSYRPDVVHIHTLMGLHKSFLESVKKKKIQLIFTTHDYFPICPKVTMFRNGNVCSSMYSCAECGVCNVTALDIKKIKILQSPLYRTLKDSFIVKKLRKKHRYEYLSEKKTATKVVPVGTAQDFIHLRKYYYSLLKLMDLIHYNSTITKTVYESVFKLPNNRVIGITHSDVSDHKKIKKYDSDFIRIRYLGPYGEGKGFFLLKAALDELWNERQNFCLDIHFEPIEVSPYMRIHKRYGYDDLEEIFDDTDVLVAPSVWYETFGYTVLEALSYGVPVIISRNVGAKDILVDGSGIILEKINSDELREVISSLTTEKLKFMNKVIVEHQRIMTLADMAHQIEKECYR